MSKEDNKKQFTITDIDPEKLKKEFERLNEFTKNNLITLQNVSHKVDEIENEPQRIFLKSMYEAAKEPKDFTVCTIFKGILKQGKVFFSISQDSLKRAIEADVDNPMKNAPKLKVVLAHMKTYGIHQLWDGIKGRSRIAGGYVVTNDICVSLLGLDAETLQKQYLELQEYTKNTEYPTELIFNGGEMRVKTSEIREVILDNRRKRGELGVKTYDRSLKSEDHSIKGGDDKILALKNTGFKKAFKSFPSSHESTKATAFYVDLNEDQIEQLESYIPDFEGDKD